MIVDLTPLYVECAPATLDPFYSWMAVGFAIGCLILAAVTTVIRITR